jgi:hypothetical protein
MRIPAVLRDQLRGEIQKGLDLFPGNGGEVLEKHINRVASLKMSDKRFDWYSSAGKHWGATEYLPIRRDHI